MNLKMSGTLFTDFIKKSKIIKGDEILIEGLNNKVKLTKSYGNDEINLTYPAEVIEEGRITLTADIYSLIKGKEPISINGDYIKQGNRKINIKNNIKVEYLGIKDDFKYPVFELSDKELKTLLEVKHASSKDETTPKLVGITIKDNYFFAIDGYRLSVRYGNFNTLKEYTVANIKMLESLKGEKITAIAGEKYIKFKTGIYEYITSYMGGEGIDIFKLFPNEYNTSMEINKKSLEESLKCMNEVSKKLKNKLIYFKITDNNCKVISIRKESKVEDSFECKTTGDKLIFGVNCQYMLDAIKDLNNLTFECTTNVNPIIIKDRNKLELVLPVRVSSSEVIFDD